MSIFKKHVFVCTEGKTCPDQGGQEVCFELRQAISNIDPNKTMRINKAGCFGQCGNGPMVVVYPEGIWYSNVSAADCKEIAEQHLDKNHIVERLVYHKPSQI